MLLRVELVIDVRLCRSMLDPLAPQVFPNRAKIFVHGKNHHIKTPNETQTSPLSGTDRTS